MRSIVYSSILKTEIGTILITANHENLIGVHFTEEAPVENENMLTKIVKRQLSEYFEGKRKHFSFFTYDLCSFQKEVLEIVMMIPYGETKSYYQIAKEMGNPRAVRAVANAISRNPYLVVIPCHRVIGKNGALHGYQGGLKRKEYLLEYEKKHCQKNV